MPRPSPRKPPEPVLLSTKDVAVILGVSRNYVYGLLDLQIIESRYIGRRRLVLKASLDAFIERLPDRPPGASGK